VKHRCAFFAMMVSFVTAITMTDAAFGETVYVAAKSAQLRSGKTSLDPVVASLKLGETLDVVKRDDRWLQVQTTKGVKGWIYHNNVSASKPAGGDNELASDGPMPRLSRPRQAPVDSIRPRRTMPSGPVLPSSSAMPWIG